MNYVAIIVYLTLFSTVVACNKVSDGMVTNIERDITTVAFSSYLSGQKEDTIRDIATDERGNIYITGGTASTDFPVSANAYDRSFNGWHDVFVAKLDPSGKLIWSTLIGGPNYDRAYAIEVDKAGFVYVAGRAGAGFPTSPRAVQQSFAGDSEPNSPYGQQDGFVTKLSPDGSRLVWSTYFGSEGKDFIRDLAVSKSGEVYLAVADVTRSHPHITAQAFQPSFGGATDGVVARLSADGTKAIYASYFGGSEYDGGPPSIRVDDEGNAYYLTHTKSTNLPVSRNAMQTKPGGDLDLVLSKISPDGSKLVYCTYIGGSNADFTETHGLAIDSQRNALVAFTTKSADVPTTPRAFQPAYKGARTVARGIGGNYSGDGFIAKISPDGARLVAATYLGGQNGEGLEGVAVDAQDNVYVTGATFSDDFPTTANGFQLTNMGQGDSILTKLTSDLGKVLYSTYTGGRDFDASRAIAIDPTGKIYVGGMTRSADWPTHGSQLTQRGADWDAIVVGFALNVEATSTATNSN